MEPIPTDLSELPFMLHPDTHNSVSNTHAIDNSRPAGVNTHTPPFLTGSDGLALQHHAVEDEADVLGWRGRARALLAQQVKDLGGQHRVLTVLDELTQVGQPRLLALWVLLDDADDAVHDGPLVLKATLRGEASFKDVVFQGQSYIKSEN